MARGLRDPPPSSLIDTDGRTGAPGLSAERLGLLGDALYVELFTPGDVSAGVTAAILAGFGLPEGLACDGVA